MLDALTLDQIRMFVTVADAGSFRLGATRVRRAQSAVSHAIANLERHLGVRLFDRSSHRPRLTDEGLALLQDARAVLLKVDTMRAHANGLVQGVETELSLVVDTLFPLPVLAQAMNTVRHAFASVRLSLALAPLGAPLHALREKRCDLAVLAGEDFTDARIQTEALHPVSIVTVAASTHALACCREPLTNAALADHLQIVLKDPSPLSDGRDFDVLSPQTLRVSSQDAKRALIVGGLGWGRLPQWMIERELADRSLVLLCVPAFGPAGVSRAQTYLAHRTDRTLGVAAMALREALRQHAVPRGALQGETSH